MEKEGYSFVQRVRAILFIILDGSGKRTPLFDFGNASHSAVSCTALATAVTDARGYSSTYGNGLKTRYEYDGLDRVKKIYQGTASNGSSTATYEFIYDGEGNLYELRNYKTNPNRATFFEMVSIRQNKIGGGRYERS